MEQGHTNYKTSHLDSVTLAVRVVLLTLTSPIYDY